MCIVGILAWLDHMCILQGSAGLTVQAAHWALHVRMQFFFFFLVQILPLLLSACPSPPFLFVTVFVCACVHMISIWWIKSNALILSQTRPLLHERSEMPCAELCLSTCHSGWWGTMQQQGSFLLTLVCPETTKPSLLPSWLGCNNKNSKWNTTPRMCNTTQQIDSFFRGLQ